MHLIMHERDEGRHDDRHALSHQCGQLKAEALAGPRRHKNKDVMAAEGRSNDGALLPPKTIMPEDARVQGARPLHQSAQMRILLLLPHIDWQVNVAICGAHDTL